MKLICRPLKMVYHHRLKCILCGNRSDFAELSDTVVCEECQRKEEFIGGSGDRNEKGIPA
jgi:hypothetical protein